MQVFGDDLLGNSDDVKCSFGKRKFGWLTIVLCLKTKSPKWIRIWGCFRTDEAVISALNGGFRHRRILTPAEGCHRELGEEQPCLCRASRQDEFRFVAARGSYRPHWSLPLSAWRWLAGLDRWAGTASATCCRHAHCIIETDGGPGRCVTPHFLSALASSWNRQSFGVCLPACDSYLCCRDRSCPLLPSRSWSGHPVSVPLDSATSWSFRLDELTLLLCLQRPAEAIHENLIWLLLIICSSTSRGSRPHPPLPPSLRGTKTRFLPFWHSAPESFKS